MFILYFEKIFLPATSPFGEVFFWFSSKYFVTLCFFSEEEYDLDVVGSPFHMAPEVLNHKPYNMKVIFQILFVTFYDILSSFSFYLLIF